VEVFWLFWSQPFGHVVCPATAELPRPLMKPLLDGLLDETPSPVPPATSDLPPAALVAPAESVEASAESVMAYPKPRRQTRTTRRRPVSARPARPRQAEEAAEAETFFRDLVWSMRNGVVAITRDGRITVMNDIAYRVLGLHRRASDIGSPFATVLGTNHELTRLLAGAFHLTHLPNRAELRLKPSGKVIGYTLARIHDSRGRISGAALFFKDLTRVEQLEERERLRDRLAALGEMAAAIAHEVKNPLAGIEVMAGVLKRQLTDSTDAQGVLTDIIHEAKMANAIVQEVLEFVRPIRLQVDRVSLPEVLQQAVSTAEAQVPRGGIEISVRLPGDLPRIQGDHHQLRQVFTNLIANAFEAMSGRGLVEIRVTVIEAPDEDGMAGELAPRQSVLIEVADNGPGVPAELADRIFSPFFTTKPRGSGLGLAIVRKIVDAHDGRIDMAPRASGGTSFRVTLPVTSIEEH
jgi:signal transduction histidine kinase